MKYRTYLQTWIDIGCCDTQFKLALREGGLAIKYNPVLSGQVLWYMQLIHCSGVGQCGFFYVVS